jgi:hypothetical protein
MRDVLARVRLESHLISKPPIIEAAADVHFDAVWRRELAGGVLRLREAAKAKLGAQFDIRAFHDQVLGRGSVTLPLLRELLEEWIAGAPSPAAAAH